jgi:hypothetical protein
MKLKILNKLKRRIYFIRKEALPHPVYTRETDLLSDAMLFV